MEPIQIPTDKPPEKQSIDTATMNPNVSYDSSFNNAAPTPIVSRANSMHEEMYQQINEAVKIENTQMHSNVNSMSEDDEDDDDAPMEPIGGILTKYKKSGLLFKPRQSYVPQNSPNSNLELQNIDFNMNKDENFEQNLNENDYEVQAPLSVNIDGINNSNNNNLSPKFSPKSDRRGSNMSTHEFNYKGRRSSKRSSQIRERANTDEDVKNNSKIRTMSDSSVNSNQQRHMNSMSSASGLSDITLQQNINNKTSVISTDVIDENKEIGPEPQQDFDINIHVKQMVAVAPNSSSKKRDKMNNKSNNIKPDDKFVSRWEYFAIFVSSITTWIFYNLYTGFYNWNYEIREFNNGLPSAKWNKKYMLLVIIYFIFIWTNMGFNPFYFSYFRKLSHSLSSLFLNVNEEYDINTKKGMIRISLIRFWVICAVIYCIVMTILCIIHYNDYSVRLAQLTVVYVLMPPLITNVIISGYLLKRQAGIFIASHSISWIISTIFVFFLFNGYDNKSLHLTYYFIVSIGEFCAYLIAIVCIKAGIQIKELDLHRQLSNNATSSSNDTSPKNIRLELDSNNTKSNSSTTKYNSYEIQQISHFKNKLKDKPIDCCCNKFQLELKMFFKIQSLISALTFWTFFGIVSISSKPKYDTITELLFVISCCWWNPMYYSTTKRVSKSINKYILNSYFIFGAFIGIIQCGIFILYWYIKVTYGKNIGINGENGIHISILNNTFVLHEQNIRYISFFAAFIVSFIFYFPATGYLFYRSPLPFGLSHLCFATMAVFIPLAITDIADRNIVSNIGIKFITNEFDRNIQNKKVTVIILYMVVFAMFLTLSGFSCTYFRFKKVLVESQAIVTGYKSLQYRLEYPMTLTMFATLIMAFGDFVTDFLFAFWETGLKSWIKFTARTLFIIQMLLQLFSLQSVIMKVRGQLIDKHSKHQLRYFREYLLNKIGKLGIILIYPFAWVIYYILLIIISLILSATKTISVRQVQQWWLQLIVVNYKHTANKKLKQHKKTQKEIVEKLQTINPINNTLQTNDDYFYTQYSNNINDNRLGLNDIHAVYWSQLQFNNSQSSSDSDTPQYESSSDTNNSIGNGYNSDDNIIEEHIQHTNNNSTENEYDENYDPRFDDDNIIEEHIQHTNNNSTENEYDENYDPRFDDDNISMRIQKINRKRQNTKLNKERAEAAQKHKKKRKKKRKRTKRKRKKKEKSNDPFDNVWLGWKLSENDLGIIFKIYLFIDKYTPKWMRHLYINANVYNTYFLTELIVESLPQCILIVTNAYLKNDWTPISIASIFFSGGMIIYNVAKIVYYVGYLNKDMRSVVL